MKLCPVVAMALATGAVAVAAAAEVESPQRYKVSADERGVTISRAAGGGGEWMFPQGGVVARAGEALLFRETGESSDRIVFADLSRDGAPRFETVISGLPVGGIAAAVEGERLHVAYSAASDDHERVYYICREGGEWGASLQVSSQTASWSRIQPAISVGAQRVRIAYAGFDGRDSEIWFVEGAAGGNTFSSERRVTDNDRVSDTSPRFEESGEELSWVVGASVAGHTARTRLDQSLWPIRPAANGEITRPAAAPNPNLFCGFGDSITEGVSDGGYSRSTRIGYYPMLISMLASGYGAAGMENRGYGGEGTTDGLARVPDVLDELSPGVMLIMEGTNDVTKYMSITEQGVRDNLAAMVVLCRAAGTRPILSTLIPRGPNDIWDPTNLRTKRVNRLIRKLVIDEHIDYSEMYDAFASVPDYSDTLYQDHVHPNTAGFELMGKTWYASVSKIPPTAPASVTASQFSDRKKMDVTWAPSPESDRAGYLVLVGTVPNAYTKVFDATNKTKYRVLELERGVTYYFRVRTYDRVGNLSDLSPEATATILAR